VKNGLHRSRPHRPIYEAIGTFGSRQIRRAMYAAVQLIDQRMPDVLPNALRARLGYPTRGEALIHTTSRAGRISRCLNTFRSPAQQRLIFEEFFLYQLSLALDRQATRKENAIAFRLREGAIREALKRILPFKPTARKNTSFPKSPPTSKSPRP